MAVVMTVRCDNGGTMTIRDDHYRGADAEELKRRRRATEWETLRIGRKVELEQMAEKGDEDVCGRS